MLGSSSSNVVKRNLVAVDLVTGKELIYVYFDYNHVVENNMNIPIEWFEEHLYSPASIVKEDFTTKTITVRLLNNEVVKIRNSEEVIRIPPNENDGVKDLLKLANFSEKSMIYNLRVRYEKDEIYTFVGPILISINPYKTITGLYTDESILDYHNKRDVSSPH